MGFVSRRLQPYPRMLFIWNILRRTIGWLFWGHLILLMLLKWLPVWTTPTIIGQQLGGKKIEKTWKPLSQISTQMQHAVIAGEDQEFEDHLGFDIDGIEKAVEYNKKHKNRKMGASTISQQVAKNVFLWQGRSWLRKGLEVYFTLMIELVWGKDRILEVYLNVAEMGDGVFGAEAAAQRFFNRSAAELTQSQAALITATLPNPIVRQVKNPSAKVLSRQRWIIRQMDNINWAEQK
jgi:monofunctional glycosyltransferase